MANLEFTTYRPRGFGQASPATNIPEGGGAVAFNDIIDDTALVSGFYKFTAVIDFSMPADKYIDVQITLNGIPGKVYRLVAHVGTPLVTDFTILFFLPLVAPTNDINMGMEVTFPDQQGANTCVVEAYQFSYEKWIDL